MDKRTWDKRLNHKKRAAWGPQEVQAWPVRSWLERRGQRDRRRSRVHAITSHEWTKCSRKVDNGTCTTLSDKDTTTSVESWIKTKRGCRTLAWSFTNSPLEMCCFSSVTSWPGWVEVTVRTSRVSKVRVFQKCLTEANISGIFDRVWERQMG